MVDNPQDYFGFLTNHNLLGIILRLTLRSEDIELGEFLALLRIGYDISQTTQGSHDGYCQANGESFIQVAHSCPLWQCNSESNFETLLYWQSPLPLPGNGSSSKDKNGNSDKDRIEPDAPGGIIEYQSHKWHYSNAQAEA